MLLSTGEDLANFVKELRHESDRGLALVATALIDDRLAETLRAFFRKTPSTRKLLDEGNAPLGSLSSRAEAAFALGLIDEYEHKEIGILRRVRNEFAHAKHGISFESARVVGLCSTLESPLPEGGDQPIESARFRFMNAAVCVVLRLYHRPDWVALERRAPKIWVEPDMTRWRSVTDEPPPEGVPVIVLGHAPNHPGR
jgi:hypothetical protein